MHEKQVTVSVIIPVFNTEEYLRECLDSVLGQRLTDIEVLCVDDGSTDASVNILEEYAQRDPRLRIVPQRPGGKGPGIARNTALEVARGEYIAFVDSDDKIHKDMLYRLHRTAVEHDAQITICTIGKFSPSSKKERYADCTFKSLIPTALDQRTFTWVDIQDVIFGLRFVAWNKLYRRDFLEKWQIRFSEGIFYEDMLFSFRAMLAAESIRFVRKEYYYNRKERDGATTSVRGPRVFDALTAMDQVADLLNSRPEYEPLLERFEAFRFKKLYAYLYRNDMEHLPPFYARLREHASSPTLARNPYLREWEEEKRAKIAENDLLSFLADELFDVRNKNARLLRQRRKLQRQTRLFRLWSGGKRRAAALLRKLLGAEPGAEATLPSPGQPTLPSSRQPTLPSSEQPTEEPSAVGR